MVWRRDINARNPTALEIGIVGMQQYCLLPAHDSLDQIMMSLMTVPLTSVSRKLRPEYWYVRCSWSIPMR